MKKLMTFITLIALLIGQSVSAQVTCGGPIFLTGDDADDHGNEAIYANIFDEIFNNVSNGQTGILALGTINGTKAGDWIATVSANMTSPQVVTYADGAAAIASVNFNNYAIVFIPSDYTNTPSGGMTQAENDALVARAGAVATFINSGGGLFGNTQEGFTNYYGYLGSVGSFTFSLPPQFDNVSTTADGQALGITETNLDHCCFHNTFTSFPSFMKVLAVADEPTTPIDGEAVIIGGIGVCVSGNCPLSQGYWRNHPDDWPASALPMMLGTSETYTKAELIDILEEPVQGNASLILAKQLIAAKLNIANGSDPSAVSSTITDADNLIGTESIPITPKVKPNTPDGQLMTTYAGVLDDYNNGNLTPSCIDGSSSKRGSDLSIESDIILSPNAPNPFSDYTSIKYYLPESSNIKVAIYDLTGKQIAVLFEGMQSSGNHTAFWTGENEEGTSVPSGIYIYTLETDNVTLQQKMIVQH